MHGRNPLGEKTLAAIYMQFVVCTVYRYAVSLRMFPSSFVLILLASCRTELRGEGGRILELSHRVCVLFCLCLVVVCPCYPYPLVFVRELVYCPIFFCVVEVCCGGVPRSIIRMCTMMLVLAG